MNDFEDPHDMFVATLWPEWRAGRMMFSELKLSSETRERLRCWNETWENVLNPISEIRWPDARVGREWIQEGYALVAQMQKELGSDYVVVEGFAVYDPDIDQRT